MSRRFFASSYKKLYVISLEIITRQKMSPSLRVVRRREPRPLLWVLFSAKRFRTENEEIECSLTHFWLLYI